MRTEMATIVTKGHIADGRPPKEARVGTPVVAPVEATLVLITLAASVLLTLTAAPDAVRGAIDGTRMSCFSEDGRPLLAERARCRLFLSPA